VIVCLSPYHLTTREPVAMASLLLADTVVTAMPTPDGALTRQRVGAVAARVPQYLELMESWAWSVPLWSAGVIASEYRGIDPIEDVRRSLVSIGTDDRYAPLRPLMHEALLESDDLALRRIAADLLKGGPDPGLAVPMASGLDAFARRFGLIAARAEAVSIAARHESAQMRVVARAALPVVLRAGGQRLLAARADLEEVLDPLRDAIDAAEPAVVRAAAAEYSEAFALLREELLRPVADEPRPVEGVVTVTLADLPHDAVLTSSASAAVHLYGGHTSDEGRDSGLVRTIVVKPVGAGGARR
jgi:hypothetical protein